MAVGVGWRGEEGEEVKDGVVGEVGEVILREVDRGSWRGDGVEGEVAFGGGEEGGEVTWKDKGEICGELGWRR